MVELKTNSPKYYSLPQNTNWQNNMVNHQHSFGASTRVFNVFIMLGH